jgi:phage host-nuclease inhibitor protein Gam
MTEALEPTSRIGRVVFELDRFELSGGDRCELQGRWFGVRGRRFMRPALTVLVEGQPTRLLADLAHKPWAAEDGESWTAAFPYPAAGGELLEAELTVAPDITIALPTPQSRPAVVRPARAQPKSPASGSGAGARELAAAARELADAQREQRRLRGQLDRMEAEKARATPRIDELLGNLTQVMRARNEAEQARDETAAERDVALSERDQATSGCDSARLERDQAVSERDTALAVADHARAERDAAVRARDEAISERDALSHENERLESRLANLNSVRGGGLVMRRAAQEGPASRPYGGLLGRAVAIIALLAIVVVLVIVLRVP